MTIVENQRLHIRLDSQHFAEVFIDLGFRHVSVPNNRFKIRLQSLLHAPFEIEEANRFLVPFDLGGEGGGVTN